MFAAYLYNIYIYIYVPFSCLLMNWTLTLCSFFFNSGLVSSTGRPIVSHLSRLTLDSSEGRTFPGFPRRKTNVKSMTPGMKVWIRSVVFGETMNVNPA